MNRLRRRQIASITGLDLEAVAKLGNFQMNALRTLPDDWAKVQELLAVINDAPALQTPLSAMLPWQEDGVRSSLLSIRVNEQSLSLVPITPRGMVGQPHVSGKGREFPIFIPRRHKFGSLTAASMLEVLALASEEARVVAANEEYVKQSKEMRDDFMITKEQVLWDGIHGLVRDADGSVVFDLDAAMKVQKQEHILGLSVATTDVIAEIVLIKEASERALGNMNVAKFILAVGDELYDGIVGHPSVKKAYDRWQEGKFLRSDLREGFEIVDGVFLKKMHKAGIWDTRGNLVQRFVEPDEGFLLPVAPIYIVRNAPAEKMAALGTKGLPINVSAPVPMRFDMGWEWDAEMNTVAACTKPWAIQKVAAA